MRQQLHPKYAQAFIDSCAFDPGGTEEQASRRILQKKPEVIVAHSVQKEVNHPNTPPDVKALATNQIYTNQTGNSPDLQRRKEQIRILVQGNAKPGAHDADAEHLFELHKFGGGYFITTDERLLSLSEELFNHFSVTTIMPSEYEAIFDTDA